MDSFFLITKQPVKNGTGFSVASIPASAIDSMMSSALLDAYITMKVSVDFVKEEEKFNSEYVAHLSNTMASINGDSREELKKTLRYIDTILPSQTAEIKKLFLSVDDTASFLEGFMNPTKKDPSIILVSWEQEPSTRTRSICQPVVIYRMFKKYLEQEHKISYSGRQKAKEELNEAIKYAVQVSISEKFIAWASLENKKLEEAKAAEGKQTHQAS